MSKLFGTDGIRGAANKYPMTPEVGVQVGRAVASFFQESGEGRWAVEQAIEEGVPAPVITLSLMRRFQSQEEDSFANRLVSALRREFGGHTVVSADNKD